MAQPNPKTYRLAGDARAPLVHNVVVNINTINIMKNLQKPCNNP